MGNSLLEHWKKSGSDFAAGVTLLREHGAALVTKSIMERLLRVAYTGDQPNAYELGKLTGALEKLAVANLSAKLSAKPQLSESSQPAASRQPPTTNNQQPVTSEKAKTLHKAHAHEHALMVTASTDAERGEHAAKIMEEIIPSLDAEYDRLRAGGEAENPQSAIRNPQSEITEADKLRRLQSLRTRIARLKNHLIPEAKTAKQKQKYETELATKEAERDRLAAELA